MESRINTKIQTYTNKFKQSCIAQLNENPNPQVLIQYILDYPHFTLETQDLQKRKRTRNSVPICERCIANRANDTQCTRRKQQGFEYCGTHMKGQPYGVVEQGIVVTNKILIKNVEIWNEEINGIHYYIDNNENVYKTEDILSNKQNPTVITKYTLVNGKYTIPSYFNK
jgi:hypothetical protein